MLPLLSITKPMLTGMSSRLKRESFCSTLSSRTRKLSCFKPSANRPRSSITVVCKTTRLTSTRILESCPPAGGPGGGGALPTDGICASAIPTVKRRLTETTRARKPRREDRDEGLMAGSVVTSLRIHVEGWKPLGRAQLDFDLSPARIMRLIAWAISQDILASQVLDAIRKGAGEFGALVEADQEEFILRIGGLEKLQRRFSSLPNFVGHAPAEIEYDADRDGYVFG